MQTGRRQAPMDIPPSHEQITVKAFPNKQRVGSIRILDSALSNRSTLA
jgi:hypothetical protein